MLWARCSGGSGARADRCSGKERQTNAGVRQFTACRGRSRWHRSEAEATPVTPRLGHRAVVRRRVRAHRLLGQQRRQRRLDGRPGGAASTARTPARAATAASAARSPSTSTASTQRQPGRPARPPRPPRPRPPGPASRAASAAAACSARHPRVVQRGGAGTPASRRRTAARSAPAAAAPGTPPSRGVVPATAAERLRRPSPRLPAAPAPARRPPVGRQRRGQPREVRGDVLAGSGPSRTVPRRRGAAGDGPIRAGRPRESPGRAASTTAGAPLRPPRTRAAPAARAPAGVLTPRSRSSARARSAGYGLVNATHRPSAGCANPSSRACSHCRASPSRFGQHRVRAVGDVADARVPQRRHVHPDLVGAPGLQVDVEQRRRRGTPRACRSG